MSRMNQIGLYTAMAGCLPIAAGAVAQITTTGTSDGTFVQYGMAGAVIIVVFGFLSFLKEERKSSQEERKEFLKQIRELGTAIEEQGRRIEHCPTRTLK